MIFSSFAEGPEGGLYYDAQPIEQMSYKLTMLAYDMNREFVESFGSIGGGLGGYNNDHEFFGYRQSI
ncbi:hypothetical protein [Paramicrobacterium fandaimingii]|uniref:hypothetical protein n=1 Tax=Paramicrobacterium fandaimingii TaxID=2708079 RepID=UPI001AB039AD|nr:hypothetical protein [Microbacterium fandaimingii]